MKIVLATSERNDWSGEMEMFAQEILCDGEGIYYISEGEPEDMYFGRNLEPLEPIIELIKKAYEAGRDGKEISFVEETESWD